MQEEKSVKKWENGEGYNRYITRELASFRKEAWKKQLGKHFPAGARLEILDVGTGPGFFACILAKEGHRVTAIDQSESMLACARENAGNLGVEPCFLKMDVNRLTFADNSFDVVVSRNVTWTLENPEDVYVQFKRVLKPGGRLLIYDANWHLHFFDDEMMKRVRARERAHFEKYGSREVVSEDDLDYFAHLPLSNRLRPQWDEEVLGRLGFLVETEEDIGRNVYEEWEKELYGESPLFEIGAVKQAMAENREKVQSYWQKRSASFGFDFSGETTGEWQALLRKHLPAGQPLQVLDVGTGTGFMAAVAASLGHEVTGVDLCSKMIEKARANTESLGFNLRFMCTDAGELPFAEGSFDAVICRNVVWTLTNPQEVLLRWRRVLKEEGTLLYFDGNHYYYLFNEEERRAREEHFARYGNPYEGDEEKQDIDFSEMERAAENLPLSRISRPEWDLGVLPGLGYEILHWKLATRKDKEQKGDRSGSGCYNTFMIAARKVKAEPPVRGRRR